MSFIPISTAFAQDVSRYPEGNVFHSANIDFSMKAGTEEQPLFIQVGVDDTFSDEQKKLLRKSLRIFLERSLKKSVLDCTFRNSNKDLPENPVMFASQLYSALSVLKVEDCKIPSFVFIARYSHDPKSVGLGYIGSFYDEDKAFPGQRCRHYLHIAINSDHLGESANSGYRYRANADYWAGVLGHEFLHNFGYVHPGQKSGSFICEYTKCLHRNGADAEDLEGELPDIHVEKEI
jgi:hypothetical protein